MKIMWIDVSTLLGKNLGVNFESIARFWIRNEKNVVTNMIVAALMWLTWKQRNDVLFGRCSWSGMQVLWMRVVKLLKRW
jgi:fructose-1,6-bisphosphatase